MSSSNEGHLPLGVVFICKIWFGHKSFSLKFGKDLTSGCWDISLLIFEVVFHWRSPSFETFIKIDEVTLKPEFKIWGRFDQWLLRYITFNLVDRVAGWVGGWVDKLSNKVPPWPYLASWDLPEFQLSWDFKIGPSGAIPFLINSVRKILFEYKIFTMQFVDTDYVNLLLCHSQ